MNFLSNVVMAKRAKEKVVERRWKDADEGLLKRILENRMKKDVITPVSVIDNPNLSEMIDSQYQVAIPEEVALPVRWASDMSMKYGIPLTDEALSLAAPRMIATKTKLSFESTLTDEEIGQLLPIINHCLCEDEQTIQSVKMWLKCENPEPIRVKDNGLFAYFLFVLQKEGYICQNCQKVAEVEKVFVGIRGAYLTQKNLSKSMSKLAKKKGFSIKVDNILDNRIFNAIIGLKR